MRINHNLSALNTFRQYNANTGKTSKAMEKLSSGLRINRAADDAAGLSISEKMRADIRGTNQMLRNTQDNISSIQTAEGALNEVSDMLIRMKELAVQKTNVTYTPDDTANIDLEMAALGGSIDSIISGTNFNGTAVLSAITFTAVDETSLSANIDAGIKQINTARATFGADQNQLEHEINNFGTTAENLQSAESRIRDVDMAQEMMEFTKNNILLQAAQAMLAQANQQPQGVLQLLK